MKCRGWVCALLSIGFASAAAREGASSPQPDETQIAVPVILLPPRFPPGEEFAGLAGVVAVGFKLDPGELGPVEIGLMEKDLPDAFYDVTKEALGYWRFRPGGDLRGCITRIQRGALVVRFRAPGETQIESLMVGGSEVPLLRTFFVESHEAARAAIERLEELMKPLEYEIDYPFKARKNGISGYVVARFLLDEHGRARDPEIVHARPPDYFEKATLKALGKARFRPPAELGKSPQVDACFIQRFNFRRLYR
jgi:TonB family protein